MNLIERYSNKEVPFRFNGVNLSFFLSQQLFSSFAIDTGTKLLLKTIAKEVDFQGINTVADIGCGVGVIGLSIKKKYPYIELILQDRDALAIAFSKENADCNGIEGINYSKSLALTDLKNKSLDLILSNLPAKAGTPVLEEFVTDSLGYLSRKGICAVVVVSTLRETILTAIGKSKAEIIHREDTREYSVFHYRVTEQTIIPEQKDDSVNLKACYIRRSSDFMINKLEYSLKTVYDLQGFDTVPYHIENSVPILEKQGVTGKTLFWNPEQGHLPVISHLLNPGKIKETVLASRDLLQLKISMENLKNTFGNNIEDSITIKHLSSPEILVKEEDEPPYDSIIVSLSEAYDSIPGTLLPIAGPHSFLIIGGKSSFISGAVKAHRGWRQLNSRKYRGFRIIVFKRN